MQSFNIPKKKFNPQSHVQFLKPLQNIFPETPQLKSRGSRPLKMTFEDQLQALIFFHLQEHESARDLIQHLKEDDFAKNVLLQMAALVVAVFLKLLIIADLNSLNMFSKLFAARHKMFYHQIIRISGNSFPLMAP